MMVGNTVTNKHVKPEEITRVRRMLESGIRVWWGKQRHRPASIGVEDLLQEADIRLWRALADYDPQKGARFVTYGYRCAFGAAQHYYRDNHHLPRGEYEDAPKLFRENGGENPEDSPYSSRSALPMWSLDEPFNMVCEGNIGEGRFVDLLSDNRDPYSRIVVEDTLERLPEHVANAVREYYLDGYSQTEVGHRSGVCQMEISRRLAAGRRLLREHWAQI